MTSRKNSCLQWMHFFFVDTYCHKSVLENIKCSEKVTNEQVLDHIEEKRTLINNILSRKANWIGHILRKKLPTSWYHWRTDYGGERSRKKKNTAPRWFEKQEKILGAKRRKLKIEKDGDDSLSVEHEYIL